MVVETRSLIFQLELRKPQENPLRVRQPKLSFRGEILLTRNLVRWKLAISHPRFALYLSSVSSAIQLNTTSALIAEP
jgi:hypothetical protein